MTSEAKRAANRANAQKSTGPRSREGKARSSQNATQHGLTRSSADDPAAQDGLAVLAASLVGEGASPALLAQAQVVAAAQLDVERARAARIRLQGRWIEALLASPASGDPEASAAVLINPHLFETLALAGTLDHAALAVPGPAARGARKTLAGIGRQLATVRTKMRERETSERREQRREAEGLTGLSRALDRYERRALSRRRTAVRHLDELRAAARPDT
jgi:hypothetical protein